MTDSGASETSLARGLGRCAALANHPATGWAGLVILCSLVGATMLEPISNPDIGWHLALGRSIVEGGSVPAVETFTHTAAGVPMVVHEWLSQLLSYAVVAAGGVPALRCFYAALTAAILVVLYIALRRERVAPALALLGTVAYATVAQGRFQIRPHMIHLLFLVVAYTWVFVVQPKLRRGELAAIFVGVVIWANLHSGALIFPVLVGLYTGVEAIQQRAGWRRPSWTELGEGDLRRLTALTALTSTAVFLTPHHVRVLPYLVESGRINAQLSVEWLPITRFWALREYLGYSQEVLWIVALSALITIGVSLGRASLSKLAVVLFLTLLPAAGQRFTAVYFAPVIFVLGELSRWLYAEGPSVSRQSTVQRAFAIAAAVLALVGAVRIFGPPRSPSEVARSLEPGRSFRRDLFPAAAVRFLDAVALDAPLYHPGRWGGYIALQTEGRHPTFSDGRWVTLGREIVEDSIAIERRDPEAFESLRAYGVDLLLLPRGWMEPELLAEEGWITLFENFNAGVYLRRDPRTDSDLERVRSYYASVGVPFDGARGFDERVALNVASTWARDSQIYRTHLDQFRKSALLLNRSGGERVRGW